MPMPKSVTKVTKHKDGSIAVSYKDNVDRCNYTIEELSKAALRDVGKVLVKYVSESAPKRTGNLRKAFASWNRKDPTTGEQVLQIGTYYSKKRAEANHKEYAPYLHLVLFSHRIAYKHQKTKEYVDTGRTTEGNNFFYNTVLAHLQEVRETEAKYLSAIEDEMEAERLCNESEGMKDEN